MRASDYARYETRVALAILAIIVTMLLITVTRLSREVRQTSVLLSETIYTVCVAHGGEGCIPPERGD